VNKKEQLFCIRKTGSVQMHCHYGLFVVEHKTILSKMFNTDIFLLYSFRN